MNIKYPITSKSFVRVQWSDKFENWSRQREKEIKAHIITKYGTPNVKVEFTPTNKLHIGITNLNESDVQNINQPETQEKIMLGWLNDNNIEVSIEEIIRLNKKVESKLIDFVQSKDNRWKLKNVSFENFLSYKDKTTIDFEKLEGITIINAKNFAGKSTIIKSILFLLFNTIATGNDKKDDAKTADDIINMYLDDCEFAKVEGEIIIDNIEYKIERSVIRKWKKDRSSYNTSTQLKFLTKDLEGNYVEQDKEEDRKATDKKIKENIGNVKDFLMTVLCTGRNIYDIIDAKPTERGLLLSRFLGLEIFEKKEDIAKEMLKDWKVKSKYEKYNLIDLETIIKQSSETIINNYIEINLQKEELKEIISKKNEVIKTKDEYLTFLNKDVDLSLANYSVKYFEDKIEKFTTDIFSKQKEIEVISNQIVVINDIFDQTKLDNLLKQKNEYDNQILLLENEISRIKKEINNLKTGEKCSSCGQSLKNVDHSIEIEQKTSEIILKEDNLLKLKKELNDLLPFIETLNLIKKKISDNEGLVFKKDKLEVEIERFELFLSKEQDNFKKFNNDIEKIKNNKELEEKIRLKQIDITDYNNKENYKNREISNIETINNNLTNKINENQELIKIIKKEEHIAKIFTIYINMMGKNGISKTIIKNSIPVLNLELAKLLSDSAEFTIEIDINLKNNEIEFWRVDNETIRKGALNLSSGYELTISALALKDVFAKVNSLPKLNLLLMDEIFSTVDNQNLELIKIFLDKLKNTIDNIFIITHNELVKEWADSIITVTKTNNISQLNY